MSWERQHVDRERLLDRSLSLISKWESLDVDERTFT
jgi:hypothetical protein